MENGVYAMWCGGGAGKGGWSVRLALAVKLEELGLLSLKQLWCDLAPLRGTA
jgi:hypothetical protein